MPGAGGLSPPRHLHPRLLGELDRGEVGDARLLAQGGQRPVLELLVLRVVHLPQARDDHALLGGGVLDLAPAVDVALHQREVVGEHAARGLGLALRLRLLDGGGGGGGLGVDFGVHVVILLLK